MTDLTKTAVELAEKELQEQEINRIKNIVKDYLREIAKKETDHKKLTKEISLLKKDLDDFKAGRLDKIAERQKIEPLSPKIVIIHKIEREYIPLKPWYSPWEVVYPIISTPSVPFYGSGIMSLSSQSCNVATNSVMTCASAFDNSNQASTSILGNSFKNFTSGSYDINGNVINL